MTEGPRFTPPALVALLALTLATPALAARHALLIGVSEYAPNALTDLPGARQDLALVREVLRARLGLQPEEIRSLLDGEATHTGIERAFADLATAVQPGDFVYIHYSGHGSLVKDFNDQGQERTGKDQTLVSFGARRADSAGLDRYDILDDELNRWLGGLADRLGESGELVYVADACHSASNTRGQSALVSRAAPQDGQESHPRAHGPSGRHPLTGAILIGAAGDAQSAYEYSPEEDTKAGLFTWHWAAALMRAESGETWRQIFERAGLGVSLVKGTDQRPQLTGERADRPILAGGLPARPAVLVTRVEGDIVTLDAGRLSGIDPGGLFARGEGADAPRVRIRESHANWSRGRIESGTLGTGDFVVERERAYATAPLRLFALAPEDPRDRTLLDLLKTRLGSLPGFAWADDQASAGLVLALVRPKRVAGLPQFAETPEGRDTLPVADPTAGPEVWVLNGGERLLHERMAVPVPASGDGGEVLARNLGRYRRVTELRRLTAKAPDHTDRTVVPLARSSIATTQNGVTLGLIRFDTCPEAAPGCFRLRKKGLWYRQVQGEASAEDLAGQTWPANTLVSFTLEGTAARERYAYLLELGPDGAIQTVFPPEGSNAEAARVDATQRRDLSREELGLLLDQPGEASLLFLSTQYPIDTRFLTQSGYERSQHRSRTQHPAPNPLEALLRDAIQGSSTHRGTSIATGAWGGRLLDYRVQTQGADKP